MADGAAKRAGRGARPESDDAIVEHRTVAELPECFVMMPISDPDGYAPGHFQRVYEDIIRPACQMAGYRATRADHVQETNLIHLDILQRLLNAPVAVCDLSTRNANVLFELGLRQAFDKPVVLIRETGTPELFDVAPLRATPYRPTRIYNEVIEDHAKIRDAILATVRAAEKNEGVNSLVRLLSLSRPAALPEVSQQELDPVLQVVRAEITALRSEMRQILQRGPESGGGQLFQYQEDFSSWDDQLRQGITAQNSRLHVVGDPEMPVQAAAFALVGTDLAISQAQDELLERFSGFSMKRRKVGVGDARSLWLVYFWFSESVKLAHFRSEFVGVFSPLGIFVHRVLSFAEE